jgi:hypothetical protein
MLHVTFGLFFLIIAGLFAENGDFTGALLTGFLGNSCLTSGIIILHLKRSGQKAEKETKGTEMGSDAQDANE